MLDRIDRVFLAVKDRHAAAENFVTLLGGVIISDTPCAHLVADRLVVQVGESQFELCQPRGDGPTSHHLTQWGEGIFAGGVATRDMAALQTHLKKEGVKITPVGDQLFLDPAETFGIQLVVSPFINRPRVAGPINYLYEFTHALRSDWQQVAAYYTRIFGLDPSRFSPIKSSRFGYQGTLTLFDPPARLDRVELSQAVDPAFAMGRFTAKRGDSLYMCYVDANDVPGLVDRLEHHKARWTPRGPDGKAEKDGLWVHPSALNGLLLGVSRETVGWEWSGRPDLVKPFGAQPYVPPQT